MRKLMVCVAVALVAFVPTLTVADGFSDPCAIGENVDGARLLELSVPILQTEDGRLDVPGIIQWIKDESLNASTALVVMEGVGVAWDDLHADGPELIHGRYCRPNGEICVDEGDDNCLYERQTCWDVLRGIGYHQHYTLLGCGICLP